MSKERHFFHVHTPWLRQDQPFISFGTGTASCVVPVGAFQSKEEREGEKEEEEEEEEEDEDEEESSTKAGGKTEDSAYVVPSGGRPGENYVEEPTLVRWLAVPVLPSAAHVYDRRTSLIRRGAVGLDLLSTCLAFAVLARAFVPPTTAIHPIDSPDLIALTTIQILALLATVRTTFALRRRHGVSLQMYALDIVSNGAVAASLSPMLLAFANPEGASVSDPLFALLPLSTLKVLPFFLRLDASCSPPGRHHPGAASKWHALTIVYRCFSLFFTISWLLAAYLFMLAHGDPATRRDECAPAIMWMHMMLMIVGAGMNNDLDMCTLSSASRPEAIVVTAIVLSVVYIAFLSMIVLTPFHKASLFAFGKLYSKNRTKKGSSSSSSSSSNNATDFATTVDAAWLKRRSLTVYVCQSKHLHPHQTRALLHELLDAESAQYPGASVSFLLPPLVDKKAEQPANGNVPDKSMELISSLVAAKQDWAHRVAFVRTDNSEVSESGEGLGNGASRLALTEAGVPLARNILLPAAGDSASEQADDRALLWCSVIRSLAQDDAAIFAEVYFPSSKMPLLEAGANHVVCLLELQWQLLGRSVGCPGISDLVMALCERKSESALDVRDRNHALPQHGVSAPLDEKEEDEGVSRILPMKIPIRYNDLPFCEAAYHLYNEFSVCVFAANASCIMDNRDESQRHARRTADNSRGEVVVLNPAYRLKAGQRCVHAIAPSSRSAFAAHTSRVDEEAPVEAAKEGERGRKKGAEEKTTEELQKDKEKEKEKEKEIEKQKMLIARRRPTSRDATELLLPADLLRPSEIPHLVPRPVRRGAPWKTPQRNAEFRRKSKHTMTGLALLMRSDPARA